MKPLSRQQIRSILDEHKETINHVAGNGTIRTHAEIYARHGNEALARYEQTRRATNEEFMRGRNLDSDRRVLDIQRVIAGDIHFRNDADRRLLVSAAEMLRSEILRLSNGNPPDDPLGTIDYRRGNGLRITLGLGMSQKAFVDKLDDMLLQLRADRPTPQSALDAHNEYRRAKADGAAGKANWLASLLEDPRGGFKARTVAVGILVELRPRIAFAPQQGLRPGGLHVPFVPDGEFAGAPRPAAAGLRGVPAPCGSGGRERAGPGGLQGVHPGPVADGIQQGAP